MAISSQKPIETERLILRQLEPSDADQIFIFMSQPSVMQYTSRAPLTELHQAKTFLSERTQGPNMYNFAVTLRAPGNPVIGILGSPNYPEIGYLFDPAYGGRGYATEALQAFIPNLFAVMPRSRRATTEPTTERPSTPIPSCEGQSSYVDSDSFQGFDFAEAHVDLVNGASVRLLERCGWEGGEVTRLAYTSPLLGVRDSVCYRIARPGCRLDEVFAAVQQDEEGQGFVPDLQ